MVIQDDGPDNVAARDHVDQLNHSTAEHDGLHVTEIASTGYQIREEPFGTKRRVRVVLMGAGASTVNFLKKAEDNAKLGIDVLREEPRHRRNVAQEHISCLCL